MYAPDPQVRRAFAKEHNQDKNTLEVLLDDPDGSVALAAEQALSQLKNGNHRERPATPEDTTVDYWQSAGKKTKVRQSRLVTKTGSGRNVW